MQKILVAIDGSEGCYKAAKKAEELALFCESDISFITVVVPETITGVSSQKVTRKLDKNIKQKDEAHEMIKECEEIYQQCETSLKKDDLKAERIISEGNDPANIICEFAEENDFDLIILADKGKSSVKRFLLGSTTEKVVRYAKTSVLVVK